MPLDTATSQALLAAGLRLRQACASLHFSPPVAHVQNPLDYAWNVHEAYLRRFATGPKQVLWLGMNPGPYGMAQTGVPFGEVSVVRDWLQLPPPAEKPNPEHPKRPMLGHACPRSEVSGARLWGGIREWFGTPESFFEAHFILNHSPQLLLEASGKNRSPEQLPKNERLAMEAVGDAHLAEAIKALQPSILVGVGRFAEARLRAVAQGQCILLLPHPSPASPAANRGWSALAEAVLRPAGLLSPRG